MQNNPVLYRENGKEFKFDAHKIVNNDGNPMEFIKITMSGELENFKNYMLQHPTIINIKEPDYGNVALHIACSKGYISMVSLLLRSGADSNIQGIIFMVIMILLLIIILMMITMIVMMIVEIMMMIVEIMMMKVEMMML